MKAPKKTEERFPAGGRVEPRPGLSWSVEARSVGWLALLRRYVEPSTLLTELEDFPEDLYGLSVEPAPRGWSTAGVYSGRRSWAVYVTGAALDRDPYALLRAVLDRLLISAVLDRLLISAVLPEPR